MYIITQVLQRLSRYIYKANREREREENEKSTDRATV